MENDKIIENAIRYKFTDDEFEQLKGTNKGVKKSLGWYEPYGGKKDEKVEGFIFFGNIYYKNENYWYYESQYGCIGNIMLTYGEKINELKYCYNSSKNLKMPERPCFPSEELWGGIIEKIILENEKVI
jgi:hypothetical protein